MPKKSKVKKTTQKQKQKQSQSISVVVNVPEKKQRQKRVKRPPRETAGVDFKAFPPQIIYPQQPLTFYPAAQPSLAKSVSEPTPVAPSILEDIGQVGTEGRVEILELAPKSQTLEELISPVSKKQETRIPITEEIYNVPIRTPKIPISLTELALKTKIPKIISEDVGIPEEPVLENIPLENIPKEKSKKKKKPKKKIIIQEEEEDESIVSFGISPEKVMTEPTGISMAEPYIKTKGRPPKQVSIDKRQKLITDFYTNASKKQVSKEEIDRVINLETISNSQMIKLIKSINKKKFKHDNILKLLENIPIAEPIYK